jgi:hypothetical protein
MNYVGALRYYMAFENFNNLQSLCRECHQHEHKKKKIHDEDDIF